MQLVSTNPVSSLVGHMYVVVISYLFMASRYVFRTDEALKGCAFLNDTLKDPKSALSVSPDDSPFQRAHGASLFKFYSTVSTLFGR